MDKLFRFSRIASAMALLIMIFNIITFFEYEDTILFTRLNFTINTLWLILLLIFFLLFRKVKIKESNLKIPSLIGAISTCIILALVLFNEYNHYNYLINGYPVLSLPQEVSFPISSISVLGLCIGLIWIAKHSNNNLTKTCGWLYAINGLLSGLLQAYYLFYQPSVAGLKIYQNTSLIITCIGYLVLAIFYFSLYRYDYPKQDLHEKFNVRYFIRIVVGIILIRVIPFLNYYGVIVSAYSAKIEEMAELSSSSGEKSYTPSSNRGISDSQYRELEKAAKEFEDACDLYNRELNKIADKATSPAYSGVMAQSLFWDCNDAFNLVRKKGARFARVLRDCGQSDRARELEQRLKSDERKYQSYKDEVNRMLGVY